MSLLVAPGADGRILPQLNDTSRVKYGDRTSLSLSEESCVCTVFGQFLGTIAKNQRQKKIVPGIFTIFVFSPKKLVNKLLLFVMSHKLKL